ncbi:hypothetical protein [Brachybacterium sp. sponge]|uniref:hypothetical protein n=1 Tax=Brachybacterium sp. sponge TaxID=1775432 RepID=UPI0007A42036|nr:hypothetical protein [Brachybacterium sp. sponge]
MHRSQQARAGRALTTGWGEGAQDPDAPGPAFQLTATGGNLASTAAPDGTGPEDLPPGRRDPHRPGRGVAAEIALLLVLVLALPPLLLGGTPAETVARRFLQALVDGDMATVQENLTPPGAALDLALAPAVVEATDARIEGFTLLSTRYEDGRAEVRTRLRVGARSLTTTLHLERRQDGAWPRPVWTLVPLTLPTVMVAIPVGTAELTVNGQRVTVPAESRPRGAEGLGIITLRMLPGLYEIEAPPRDGRLDPVPARINVPPMLSPWTSVPLQAGYALTDTGEQQLAGALHDSLLECLRSTSPAPPGCPLAAPGARGLSGSWRLISPPEISVSAGWMGVFTLYARGGLAEFTVPAADGQTPRTHRVLLDARAMGALDREGEFVTSWNE